MLGLYTGVVTACWTVGLGRVDRVMSLIVLCVDDTLAINWYSGLVTVCWTVWVAQHGEKKLIEYRSI